MSCINFHNKSVLYYDEPEKVIYKGMVECEIPSSNIWYMRMYRVFGELIPKKARRLRFFA